MMLPIIQISKHSRTRHRVMMKLLFLLLVILLIWSGEVNSAPGSMVYKVLLTKTKLLYHDPEICRECVNKITPRRGKSATFTSNCNFPYPLNDIWLSFQLFYKYKVYREFLVKGVFDICKLVGGADKNVLFDKFQPLFLANQTLIHPCPYVGKEGLENFAFNGLSVPFLPAGLYRLDYRFYLSRNNHTVNSVQLFFEIKPVGAADLSFG